MIKLNKIKSQESLLSVYKDSRNYDEVANILYNKKYNSEQNLFFKYTNNTFFVSDDFAQKENFDDFKEKIGESFFLFNLLDFYLKSQEYSIFNFRKIRWGWIDKTLLLRYNR